MPTYSNRLQPALRNLLKCVVRFFHPRSSCRTYISADIRRITLNVSSCITISGERTEQLDVIAGYLPRHWLYEWFSQFHSCGIIRFFHMPVQLFNCSYGQFVCAWHFAALKSTPVLVCTLPLKIPEMLAWNIFNIILAYLCSQHC